MLQRWSELKMMSSRSGRAETRQSRKEDIKRVMHNVEKVLVIIVVFRKIHTFVLML